ncbi:sensor histidine kinase [Lederbergia sp. NSJ-179]|uniref:sensor histidine kinase n=1 Tax=Lederbergia sp. NSJ-179 TaxID=2931402 RepID=UPI001FD19751|nr:sensor histidine kinase [Lederbergia sp. NSJ-179]MCJ7840485.1 sensor histidine kinase [Lederbergia sp. NSJ-179]
MYKIQTKTILFFILLFLILNSYPFFLIYTHTQTIEEYDQMLNRFFIFNDASKATNELYANMGLYLNKKQSESYDDYMDVREELLSLTSEMDKRIKNSHNKITITNYQNMIHSFIDESDDSLSTFLINDVESYSMKQREALKLLEFIQEETLDLLNNDLTEFHSFYENMKIRNQYMNYMGISLFIGTFLTGLFIAYVFSRDITNPINRLTGIAKDIAKGNLDGEELHLNRKDELGFLTETMTQMRRDLSYYVKQIKEKSEQEKLLKEMELKSLQNQINPHFLFNALNTIARTAYLDGSQHISNLITALSKMLRYNLGKLEKPVTLRDEMNNVKEYFYIQKTRFGERVHFELDLPDDCASVRLPILTVQPLVENAFIHGIESMESDGEIHVNAQRQGPYTIVQITDNGMGMDPKIVQQLKDRKEVTSISKKRDSTGLGLGNVIRRLELFYQRSDVVQIESEVGKGTTIMLKLGDEDKWEQKY